MFEFQLCVAAHVDESETYISKEHTDHVNIRFYVHGLYFWSLVILNFFCRSNRLLSNVFSAPPMLN